MLHKETKQEKPIMQPPPTLPDASTSLVRTPPDIDSSLLPDLEEAASSVGIRQSALPWFKTGEQLLAEKHPAGMSVLQISPPAQPTALTLDTSDYPDAMQSNELAQQKRNPSPVDEQTRPEHNRSPASELGPPEQNQTSIYEHAQQAQIESPTGDNTPLPQWLHQIVPGQPAQHQQEHTADYERTQVDRTQVDEKASPDVYPTTSGVMTTDQMSGQNASTGETAAGSIRDTTEDNHPSPKIKYEAPHEDYITRPNTPGVPAVPAVPPVSTDSLQWHHAIIRQVPHQARPFSHHGIPELPHPQAAQWDFSLPASIPTYQARPSAYGPNFAQSPSSQPGNYTVYSEHNQTYGSQPLNTVQNHTTVSRPNTPTASPAHPSAIRVQHQQAPVHSTYAAPRSQPYPPPNKPAQQSHTPRHYPPPQSKPKTTKPYTYTPKQGPKSQMQNQYPPTTPPPPPPKTPGGTTIPLPATAEVAAALELEHGNYVNVERLARFACFHADWAEYLRSGGGNDESWWLYRQLAGRGGYRVSGWTEVYEERRRQERARIESQEKLFSSLTKPQSTQITTPQPTQTFTAQPAAALPTQPAPFSTQQTTQPAPFMTLQTSPTMTPQPSRSTTPQLSQHGLHPGPSKQAPVILPAV